MHELSEREANRLLTTLADASISAKRVRQPDGTWAIAVSSSDSINALRHIAEQPMLLERRRLPEASSGMISSREEERFRFERALSHEIEDTLLSLPGVVESHVHLNLPLADPIFGRPLVQHKGSASVLLVTRGDRPLESEISSLVAGAAGLSVESIKVVVRAIEKSLPAENEKNVPISAQFDAESSDERIAEINKNWSWLYADKRLLLGLAILLLGLGAVGLIVHRKKVYPQSPTKGKALSLEDKFDEFVFAGRN